MEEKIKRTIEKCKNEVDPLRCAECEHVVCTTSIRTNMTKKEREKYLTDKEKEWNTKKHDISTKHSWTVYVLKPVSGGSVNSFGKHHSLLLVRKDGRFNFTVELVVHVVHGENSTNFTRDVLIEMDTKKHNLPALNNLGTIHAISAREVMDKAIIRMGKFDEYREVTHNCQDYCNEVAKDLGLSSHLTDTNKAVLALLAVTGVYVLYRICKK